MVGLYKIISPSNNVYIGQSRDILKRWSRYKDINSAQRQPSVLRSFKKYGIDKHKFEIITELPKDVTQKVLDEYEIFYIQQYKECGFILLNIKEGGLFGSHGEKTRIKIGLSKIGNKNMLGKKHTIHTKEKISLTKRGNSPAWNKGIPWPQKVKEKMYRFPKGNIPANAVLNKEKVIEIKTKLRQGYTGVYLSKEYNVTPACISGIKLGKLWPNIIISD